MNDEVYEQHKAKHVEAYNYHPDREPQGHSIEEVKAYAAHHIEDDDARSMRIASINEVDRLCSIISSTEGGNMLPNKILSAFRMMGYNVRYHNLLSNNSDILYTLGETIHNCDMTYTKSVLTFSSMDYNLFANSYSVVHRVNKNVVAEAQKEAKKCHIPLSTLNLYNVLSGIEVFRENDPHYFEKKGEWIVEACLDVLDNTRQVLTLKDVGLRAILEYVK